MLIPILAFIFFIMLAIEPLFLEKMNSSGHLADMGICLER
jgi:hypothetical protein